jgi:hypothetical protein
MKEILAVQRHGPHMRMPDGEIVKLPYTQLGCNLPDFGIGPPSPASGISKLVALEKATAGALQKLNALQELLKKGFIRLEHAPA